MSISRSTLAARRPSSSCMLSIIAPMTRRKLLPRTGPFTAEIWQRVCLGTFGPWWSCRPRDQQPRFSCQAVNEKFMFPNCLSICAPVKHILTNDSATIRPEQGCPVGRFLFGIPIWTERFSERVRSTMMGEGADTYRGCGCSHPGQSDILLHDLILYDIQSTGSRMCVLATLSRPPSRPST